MFNIINSVSIKLAFFSIKSMDIRLKVCKVYFYVKNKKETQNRASFNAYISLLNMNGLKRI